MNACVCISRWKRPHFAFFNWSLHLPPTSFRLTTTFTLRLRVANVYRVSLFFIKFIIKISLFTVRFTTFLTFYVAAMALEAPESDTLRDSLNALRDHLNVFADIQGYRVVVQQSKKTCANGTFKFEDRHRQSKVIREYTRDKRTTPYGQGNFR